MLKKIVLTLILMLSAMITVSAQDEGILFDDCVDLSVVRGHSDGIYSSVIEEESRSAYENDFTMLMRREPKEEWVEYQINAGQYPVFYTYFRQNEDIAHFTFEQSSDGTNWTIVKPQIKITEVDSYKWIPVRYTLSGIDENSKFVRIHFNDKNTVEWSPMLASVKLAYRNATSDNFADCVGTVFEEAVSKLKNLGFVNGYNEYEYKPYNNVKRAEFAKIISVILNTGVAAEDVFSDVKNEHWAYGYVASLYRQGIINGDVNGCFNPESNITYTEAAKMLVCSLGYTINAEEAGGYPFGYIKLAERLHIFDEVEASDKNSALSRGDMAVMVSSALEQEILVQKSFGENPYFEKRGTILSEYQNIEKIDGVVSGADGMSIIGDVSVGTSTAVIGEEVYDMTNFDVSGFLGMEVTAYVSKADDKILYAVPEAKRVIDITAEQYLYMEEDAIHYDDGTYKEAKAVVDNNTRVIYNGRYYSRIGVLDNLELKCGNIRLIYNGSNAADTIIITDYETYLAQTDGSLNGVINDRLSGLVRINTDTAERMRVWVYGEETELENAAYAKGDIISVAVSKDGKIIEVDVSTALVSGVVEYYDKNEKKIRVNSDEYKLTDNFKLLNGELKAGVEMTFYTDINGRVFASESTEGSKYVYLIAAGGEDSFGKSIKLKVLLSTGEIALLTADENTSFCGIRNRLKEISELSPQLLKIRQRCEGSVSHIDVSGVNNFSTEFSSESCKYYGGAMSVFASKYQLSDNTPIFYIPTEKDDNKYKVINKYELYTDFNYNVRLFDVSDEYMAGAVVIYENGSRARIVDSYDEAAIIKDVEQIMNSDGELCLKLSVYIRGEDREVYFDNDGGIDMTGNWLKNHSYYITAEGNNPFKKGDVIQYYSDSESHCRSFRMLFTRELIDGKLYYEKNTGDYGLLSNETYFSELYTAFANVYERFSDKVLISVDGTTLRTVPLGNANVYVYNHQRNTLKLGTKADIAKGGEVFVRMVYADAIDIVVIER